MKFQVTLIYISVLKGDGGGFNKWVFSGKVSAHAIPDKGEEFIIDDIVGDADMGEAKVAKRVHILAGGVVHHHVVLEISKSVEDVDVAHGLTLEGDKEWVEKTLIPRMKTAGLALAPNDCVLNGNLKDLDRHQHLPTWPPRVEKWRETLTGKD